MRAFIILSLLVACVICAKKPEFNAQLISSEVADIIKEITQSFKIDDASLKNCPNRFNDFFNDLKNSFKRDAANLKIIVSNRVREADNSFRFANVQFFTLINQYAQDASENCLDDVNAEFSPAAIKTRYQSCVQESVLDELRGTQQDILAALNSIKASCRSSIQKLQNQYYNAAGSYYNSVDNLGSCVNDVQYEISESYSNATQVLTACSTETDY